MGGREQRRLYEFSMRGVASSNRLRRAAASAPAKAASAAAKSS
jgi:hypothetical protein